MCVASCSVKTGFALLQRAHLLVRVERNELPIDAFLTWAMKLPTEMKPSLLVSRNLAKLSMAYWSRQFKFLIAFLKLAMLINSVLSSLWFWTCCWRP